MSMIRKENGEEAGEDGEGAVVATISMGHSRVKVVETLMMVAR